MHSRHPPLVGHPASHRKAVGSNTARRCRWGDHPSPRARRAGWWAQVWAQQTTFGAQRGRDGGRPMKPDCDWGWTLHDSVEDFQCRFLCNSLEHAWRTRDRTLVPSYTEFLAVRTRMQAHVGMYEILTKRPPAYLSQRAAMRSQVGEAQWRINSNSDAGYTTTRQAGVPPAHDVFGGAPHMPGMWHSYRNSDGTWGPEGGIMDASRWLPGVPVPHWSWDCPPVTRRRGSRDPNWDGVLVPKTPGKAKRRKVRRREEKVLLLALRAAQRRAMGWEMGTGWGGDWLTESQWDEKLAEPRAEVARARAALEPMYYM
ncbi:hypothetical protein C8R47DRAFT_1082278 [Mycena vitilis]|nr:hypothetical protein C8R47DRAFT_1082278 [Mycena vitilis]